MRVFSSQRFGIHVCQCCATLSCRLPYYTHTQTSCPLALEFLLLLCWSWCCWLAGCLVMVPLPSLSASPQPPFVVPSQLHYANVGCGCALCCSLNPILFKSHPINSYRSSCHGKHISISLSHNTTTITMVIPLSAALPRTQSTHPPISYVVDTMAKPAVLQPTSAPPPALGILCLNIDVAKP